MRELWEILKDHVVDISRAFWEHYCQSPATRGQLSAAEMQGVIEGSSFYLASMISDPTGPGWVELARQNVLATYCAGTPLAAILGAHTACQRKINAILCVELRGDPVRYARLSVRTSTVECSGVSVTVVTGGLLIINKTHRTNHTIFQKNE